MTDIIKKETFEALYKDVAGFIKEARQNVIKSVNQEMIYAYWHIGRRIVENEQKGEARAAYGKKLIPELSKKLTKDFGKGFTATNLRDMRQFYLVFSKHRTLCGEFTNNTESSCSPKLNEGLTWSHYRLLMRLDDPEAREWYMDESSSQQWSVRALDRQINTLYYERLVLSKNKKPVIEEAKTKLKKLEETPEDFIKNPYVLEFLNLKDRSLFRESELEQALIDKLQDFLLELGRGFAFVARQKRITAGTKEFYIDLVFYNYQLKCFFLLDLKRGELTHQDIGQMDMYVRLFDAKEKSDTDNPTVGLILCREKNEVIVKYSMLNDNKQLFASKYKPYLPSKKELVEEVNRELQQLESSLDKDK